MGQEKFSRPLLAPGFADEVSDSRDLIVSLSAAQLKAMFGAPVNVMPAAGAAILLIIEEIAFKLIPGSVAFTGGGTVQFQYHSSPNAVVHQGTIPASVITSASPGVASYSFLPPAAGSNALLVPANDGVDITNNTGAFAVGNGTALVYIRYRKIKL